MSYEHPTTETWKALNGVLGARLVSQLVGSSESQVRRYATSEAKAPPAQAERIQFLNLVVDCVRVSYPRQDAIRDWFGRPHIALDGRQAIDLLAPVGDNKRRVAAWSPTDEKALRVLDFAARLTANPAKLELPEAIARGGIRAVSVAARPQWHSAGLNYDSGDRIAAYRAPGATRSQDVRPATVAADVARLLAMQGNSATEARELAL
jgi:hypothetical protein